MFAPLPSMLSRALPVLLAGALLHAGASAQEEGTPAAIALAEKSAALDAAVRRIQDLEQQLAAAGEQATALRESLATANAESLQFSESYQNLRLKVEALGPELLEKGDSGIRAKLLSAVRDLGILRKENQRLADQLLAVTEAIMAYTGSADEGIKAELLQKVESELRSADQLLGFRMDVNERPGPRLDASQVVSLKKEWGLVVLNSGSAGGTRVGTPLEIVRENRTVATATIVDVRETISGAILTSTPAGAEESVRIGDGIRLAIEQNLQNQ